MAILLACLGVSLPACAVTRTTWPQRLSEPIVGSAAGQSLAAAESLYEAAAGHERQCLESCVDLYFKVAAMTCAESNQPGAPRRCRDLHNAALSKVVSTGQHFARFEPNCGLHLRENLGSTTIPVSHQGFVWDSADFGSIESVNEYDESAFSAAHRSSGIGIPVVVTSDADSSRPYLTPRIIFPATLVLRERTSNSMDEACSTHFASRFQLDFFDPLRVDQVDVCGAKRQLAKDTTAAIAFRLRGQRPSILKNFINSESTSVTSRLYSLEPYQPNKIPIVFVHGLLSDPFTWVEMVNELQATEGVIENFQFWFFEYPTGQPFLTSAKDLREQMAETFHRLDPQGIDVAMSNSILVGHSMGGLIAKLLVSSSGDQLWSAVANRPIEQVAMSEEFRAAATQAFFFNSSDYVSRVVYIATPHRGSVYARRMIGRLGSTLVSEPFEKRTQHRQLIDCNPGVFTRELTRGIPTSIDLLEPNSQLLSAMATLPFPQEVAIHSIIGNGRWTLGYGASDGFVPVSSARESRAISERYIHEKHEKLNKHPEAVEEVIRLLQQHLLEVP